MGLPGLSISDQRRVSKKNCACKFVLDAQQKMLDRGSGVIRENLNNSLHWCIPQEAEMWVSDQAGGILAIINAALWCAA